MLNSLVLFIMVHSSYCSSKKHDDDNDDDDGDSGNEVRDFNINEKDTMGKTPLHRALEKKLFLRAKVLMKKYSASTYVNHLCYNSYQWSGSE